MQGSIKIAQVNLAKLLERKELRGIVSALVEVNGSGFGLANLAGQGEANIRSTEVATWNLDDVSLKASLAGKEGKMTGHLKSELGYADWQGQIAFTDIPRYELSFSANQLDIQKLSSGQAIKGNLNLSGLVKGSGLTLAAMNTLAKIDLQRSTVGGGVGAGHVGGNHSGPTNSRRAGNAQGHGCDALRQGRYRH
jgi:hypothetical protein